MYKRNPIHHVSSAKALATKESLAATVDERRMMKNVAQPEHAYTGCIPQRSEPEDDAKPVKKNPPILGYMGHLRNEQDHIGTTFTKGLAVSRGAQSVSPTCGHGSVRAPVLSNNQKEALKKPHYKDMHDKDVGAHRVRFPPQPNHGKLKATNSRSEYGAFDNASGYGEFQKPPQMSGRSGYGAFDNASGYGEFQKPPQMSCRSGYGAFDNASGYGEFQARPATSPRSGYGAFDNASGYGEFQKPPQMSGRSGYGAFDNASGYGEFAAAPPSPSLNTANQPPDPPSSQVTPSKVHPILTFKYSDSLDKKYQQALKCVGGKKNALQLWRVAAASITSRHSNQTSLLQRIKRSFEKREHENGGNMTKDHLKEALQSLACVFTDDQVTALFGVYDTQCKGVVPMETFLIALSDCL
uniref:EF-hand domain-containing protein n=1 Tax=Globisporangium ultimum (strain ATCC 200006 / CBS 805.95 / DAOM BR144) TaxID=431595 RepID=K3WRQ9_GLOUD